MRTPFDLKTPTSLLRIECNEFSVRMFTPVSELRGTVLQMISRQVPMTGEKTWSNIYDLIDLSLSKKVASCSSSSSLDSSSFFSANILFVSVSF